MLVADLREPASGLPFVADRRHRPGAVQAAFDEAEKQFGSVDRAVLSAGLATTMGRTPETVDLETYWHTLLGVNVGGVDPRRARGDPALRRAGGGGIVALASLAGLTPAVGDPLYSTTKFAVVGLVRTLGPQLAGEKITINAVCPGFVDTPMVDPLRDAFAASDFPLIPVPTVVDTILGRSSPSGGTGECWLIQPGHDPGAVPVPWRARCDLERTVRHSWVPARRHRGDRVTDGPAMAARDVVGPWLADGDRRAGVVALRRSR